MEERKILVVDDDPDIVETLRFRLEQEGFEVVTAGDGYEALEAARAMKPDLIVLDVMMPRENGYLVAQHIKEDVRKGVYGKNIAVLLLTARVLDEPDREEMFLKVSQADHMMYKPFDMVKLLEKVQELLAS